MHYDSVCAGRVARSPALSYICIVLYNSHTQCSVLFAVTQPLQCVLANGNEMVTVHVEMNERENSFRAFHAV